MQSGQHDRRSAGEALRYSILFLAAMLCAPKLEAGVHLTTLDAVVWGRSQVVTGYVDTLMDLSGILYLNGSPYSFAVAAGSDTFSVPVQMGEGLNVVVARVDSSGFARYSDTLGLVLGYPLRPEVYAYATANGPTVHLHATVVENPDTSMLSFSWAVDPGNPLSLAIDNAMDSAASVTFPPAYPTGGYGFILRISSNKGDTVYARTLVVADSTGLQPLDISRDHASWIDSAIIYEITPYIFVGEGRFSDITAKIPELAQLGINTIWLQPVYTTSEGGQGYDVTDYFGIRSDLGNEITLRTLIATAHAHQIRVLFDFVPNHTSIHHPYAQHSVTYGTRSHYYQFYQRTFDNAPYSQHYKSYQGFVNYFWDELPNLNYDNPEVRKLIIEAGKFWVENFGIDGYRVDAAWGPGARAPEFFKEWRLALKRLKPDLLLLAEDKATWASVFDQRFDAAYDWAPEESWVSHWVWQTTYSTTSNPTIFNNGSQNSRAGLLRAAMTNSGNGYVPGAKVLRFMENNDTFRFLPTHDLARTKMVAAMMFSIPGIPLLYNGQEIGASTHPYSTYSIFSATHSIQSRDPYGLFGFYQLLARMRLRFPALTENNFAEMPVTPGGAVFAYRRWKDDQNIFCVMNMGSSGVTAAVTIPVAELPVDSAKTYYLSDQITNEVLAVSIDDLAPLSIQVPAYTMRILVLDTTAITGVPGSTVPAAIPVQMSLSQNYPNPFNPVTTIEYTIAGVRGQGSGVESEVRGLGSGVTMVRLIVYDLLGREVAVLVNGPQAPGKYMVRFDGTRFSSGVYFYRLESDGRHIVKRMLLVK
jgi:cyclomaltodextrinase / maltogenic alpha-amylase / neopullulanase